MKYVRIRFNVNLLSCRNVVELNVLLFSLDKIRAWLIKAETNQIVRVQIIGYFWDVFLFVSRRKYDDAGYFLWQSNWSSRNIGCTATVCGSLYNWSIIVVVAGKANSNASTSFGSCSWRCRCCHRRSLLVARRETLWTHSFIVDHSELVSGVLFINRYR